MIPYQETQKHKPLTAFFTPTDPQSLYYELLNSGKLTTHRNALLRLLSDNLPHDALEVQKAAGLQYNARIYELRRFGFEIASIRKANDTFFVLKDKLVV